jgi:hypothetical protein
MNDIITYLQLKGQIKYQPADQMSILVLSHLQPMLQSIFF